jgi:hypothetical protein
MTFYDLLGDTLIVHHRDEVAGDEPEARPSAARYEPRSSPSWS